MAFALSMAAPTASSAVATAPQAPAAPSGKTKFLDLPPEVRALFEKLEWDPTELAPEEPPDVLFRTHIQTERDLAETIKNSGTFAAIRKVSQEKEQLSSKLDGVRNLLDSDTRWIEDLKGKIYNELRNTELIARHIDRMRDPQKARAASLAAQEATADYFQHLASTFEERIRQYRVLVEEIERNLASLDTSDRFDPRAIADIIKAQNETFMVLASKVATMHDEIARQQAIWEKSRSSTTQPLSDIAATMSKSVQQQPVAQPPPTALAAPAASSGFGGFTFSSGNKRR